MITVQHDCGRNEWHNWSIHHRKEFDSLEEAIEAVKIYIEDIAASYHQRQLIFENNEARMEFRYKPNHDSLIYKLRFFDNGNEVSLSSPWKIDLQGILNGH